MPQARLNTAFTHLPIGPAPQVLLVGILFFLTSLSARVFVLPPETLAPVWVATAILMFAWLRIEQTRTAIFATVAAFAGGLAANCLTHIPLLPSALFALVNCLAGVLGGVLLKVAIGQDARLNSTRSLGLTILYAAGVANLAGAICGAAVIASLRLGPFGSALVTWWLSNTLGVLIVVPLASEWPSTRDGRAPLHMRALFEAAAILTAVIGTTFFAFNHGVSPSAHSVTLFLVFPLLVWAGLRFNMLVAAAASSVVTLVVLLVAIRGIAADASAETVHRSVLELQMFMVMAVISCLVPAAALAERRRSERAVAESEQHFQFAMRAAGAGSWSWKVGTDELFLGPESQRMLSVPPGAGLKQALARIEPADVPAIEAALKACAEAGVDYAAEFRVTTPDGQCRWIEARGQRIEQDGSSWIYGINHDVTVRKTTEAALRRSEQQFRSVFEGAAIGMGRVRFTDARWIDVNDTFCHMLGYTREEMLATPWPEQTHPDDLDIDLGSFKRMAAGEITKYTIEKRFLGKDGHVVWARLTLSLVRDAEGRPDYEIAIIEDISQRKHAEEALRESEQRFRAVAENIPQMIWVASDNARFQYLSPKWLEYTGSRFEQNQDGGWTRYIHPDDLPGTVRLWDDAISTRGTFQAEYRLRRHDGEYRWHLSRAVPTDDRAGRKTLWFGTTTDIEEQKRAQRALVQSEKLAAAGRLASSMAHEINNPLGAAINAMYLVSLDPGLSDSSRRHIDLAQRELERVAHITKQTLGFYRETGKPAMVNLRNVVDNVVELYGPRLHNKEINVERQFLTEAPVYAIEGEVRQMVSNLFSNSIDAVSNGGRIRLRVAGPVTLNDQRPAVRLTVSDNGSGIEPHNLKRMFEPFFSTKEATGTGLGLWVTQELIRKHKGKIRARSKPGQGTVFQVFLPVERRNQRRLALMSEATA